MNITHLLQAFAALPRGEQMTWGSVTLAAGLAMLFVLLLERRYFRARHKAGSWGGLRAIGFLLLLPLTVASVWLPAAAAPGMEALAWFYAALLIVAPALWFGGHLLLGRLLRPAFETGESLALATSGLLVIGIGALGLSFVQAPVLQASAGRWEPGIRAADSRPLPLHAPDARVFDMVGVGKVYSQSLLAPPGLRVERIDRQAGERFFDTQGLTIPLFCRQGQDIHLLWSAREETPRLRIHFRDPHGQLVHATWDAAANPPATLEPFAVGFREDGLDLPVPVARSRASLLMLGAGGQTYRNMLDRLQPGEGAENNCLGPAYRRSDWQREGPIQALTLVFHLPGGRPPGIAEFKRPGSAGGP
jgi:hypothetical protein